MLVGVVGDETLEAGDGQRLVDVATGAVGLAEVRADAAADGREGVRLAGDGVGLGVAAVGDEGQVSLRAGVHRAGPLAGAVPLLGHEVGAGDRLRVELVDRLALAEALVVVIGHGDGADGRALAAARALVGVHETRVTIDPGAEVARLALEADQLRGGDHLDVEMSAGLDQLGRQRAHRAVVGGEGLVELGHMATQGRCPLDEVDLVPPFGEIERALDTRDAASHDQRSTGGLGW